jgi:hypothetical protein
MLMLVEARIESALRGSARNAAKCRVVRVLEIVASDARLQANERHRRLRRELRLRLPACFQTIPPSHERSIRVERDALRVVVLRMAIGARELSALCHCAMTAARRRMRAVTSNAHLARTFARGMTFRACEARVHTRQRTGLTYAGARKKCERAEQRRNRHDDGEQQIANPKQIAGVRDRLRGARAPERIATRIDGAKRVSLAHFA